MRTYSEMLEDSNNGQYQITFDELLSLTLEERNELRAMLPPELLAED